MLQPKKPMPIKKQKSLEKRDAIFTKRERQCFKYIEHSQSILQITTKLGITQRTLYFYVNNILKKARVI